MGVRATGATTRRGVRVRRARGGPPGTVFRDWMRCVLIRLVQNQPTPDLGSRRSSLVARVLRVGRGARASRPPRARRAPARLPAATSGRSRSPSPPPQRPTAPRCPRSPRPRPRPSSPRGATCRVPPPGRARVLSPPPGRARPRGPSPPRRRGRGGGGDGEHRRHVRGPQGARAVRVRALHLRGRPQPRRHRQGAQDPRRRRRGRHRARRPVLRPPRGRTHHPGARATITQTERARTRRGGDHGRGHRATTNDPVRAAPRPRADRSIANPPYPKRLPSSAARAADRFFSSRVSATASGNASLSRRKVFFSSVAALVARPPPPPHPPPSTLKPPDRARPSPRDSRPRTPLTTPAFKPSFSSPPLPDRQSGGGDARVGGGDDASEDDRPPR